MNAVLGALRELAGLFLDDASLAIAVLVVLASTAMLVHAAGVGGSAAMALLVGGVVAALVENVLRTARIRAVPGSDR
jgi:hypothetical protein